MADALLSVASDAGALELPAPAKLNLFLHITGRRADGYHLLQTLFQFLDYSDLIRLRLRDDGRILRPHGGEGIPEHEDLTMKAACLLRETCPGAAGADIEVDKRLPMGGGLGGGSSDAATVLLGLNRLWNCGLALDELAALGLRLGADVPVFVRGRAAWAEGVGEQLEPVTIPEKWYLVLHPNVSVSTAALFRHEGLTRHCPTIKMATFLAGRTSNVFEPVVKAAYPAVDAAFNWLSRYANPKLTGSGACLFAEFEHELEAKHVMAQLPAIWSGFVARSSCVSPLHQALQLGV